VAKAFLDAGLLPRVIAGTFAGGLVATLVCTCIDVELKTLLILELTQKLTACEDTFNVRMKHFWTTSVRFDSVTWACKVGQHTQPMFLFYSAHSSQEGP
jgi:predicted acylesterase/phospholipase RssA